MDCTFLITGTPFCSFNLLYSIFHLSDSPKNMSVEIDPLHKCKVSSPSQEDESQWPFEEHLSVENHKVCTLQ